MAVAKLWRSEFVMSRVATERRSVRSQVLEHKAQLGLCLRVTVAAVLGFALAHLLSVPLPLWTVLTAMLLTQATFGSSVEATINYLAGTLGGAVYAGAVAALVPHANDVSLAGVLAIAVAPLALLGAVYPNYGAATFTGALVLLVPGMGHVGPIEFALNRVLEVTIGGLTALAVSLLVFPARAHSFAIEDAARMLDRVAGCLPELFEGFVRPRDTAAILRIENSFGQAVAQTEAIAAEARHERIGFLAAEPNQGPLLRMLLRLRHDLVMIGRAAAEPLPETLQARLGPSLMRVAGATADQLRRRGEALIGRRETSAPDATEAAFDDFAEALAAVRREGLTRGLAADAVERFFTLGFGLDQVRQDLRDLDRCVREAARTR
jgi:uncharacterized membrane protein YccC